MVPPTSGGGKSRLNDGSETTGERSVRGWEGNEEAEKRGPTPPHLKKNIVKKERGGEMEPTKQRHRKRGSEPGDGGDALSLRREGRIWIA